MRAGKRIWYFLILDRVGHTDIISENVINYMYMYMHMYVHHNCIHVQCTCIYHSVHISPMWMFLPVGFTGIDSAYEAPLNPDLVLKAGEKSVQDCVEEVVEMLADKVHTWEEGYMCGVGAGWEGGEVLADR